jgi:4-hydroxybutyryl-CoA dehydratase/vinylacetyl-CoA-Delta-isomerase
VIFEDVFVPWERVFMCGETQFAGKLVERFASYHRQSYGGCKVGVGDVLIGAVATLMEIPRGEQGQPPQGQDGGDDPLNETLYACGIACSADGPPRPPAAPMR